MCAESSKKSLVRRDRFSHGTFGKSTDLSGPRSTSKIERQARRVVSLPVEPRKKIVHILMPSGKKSDSILPGSIGSGRYAKVKQGVDLYTGSTVALKVIPRLASTCIENSFKREIRMLNKLTQLPNSTIARFCEIKDHWTTVDHFVIAYDKYGDNLATVLQNPRISAIPLYQAKEITRQLIQAVRFLHANHIIHTNLTPANILFTSNDTTTQHFYGLDNVFHQRTTLKSSEIRLIDFGDACEKGEKCNKFLIAHPEWYWTYTVDHFALGCIIAQILTSSPLLQAFTGGAIEDIIIMDKIIGPFPDSLTTEIQKEFSTAFNHRRGENNNTSIVTQKFLQTAKSIKPPPRLPPPPH
ncbi:kinase-like domain-containing protein [Mycena metata]|uniref:Kinase-like domain-containing protein n=1 Tax=Mycena metata TaxID=1033252 RepID=A0AAD7MND9_9AGAR|nr:kinase-like domain-containing protein [Mycena metata]